MHEWMARGRKIGNTPKTWIALSGKESIRMSGPQRSAGGQEL